MHGRDVSESRATVGDFDDRHIRQRPVGQFNRTVSARRSGRIGDDIGQRASQFCWRSGDMARRAGGLV